MSAPSSAPLAQRFVYAGMAICVFSMASLLWMPSLLGALAQGYGLGPQQLSYLAFGELSGFLLGTLFTSSQSLDQLKRWVLVAMAALIGINVTLLLFAPAVPFLALRPLAGVASGIGYGYGLKVCGRSVHPTRSFGIFTAAMSLMMIIGFQTLASLIDARGTINGLPDAASIRSIVRIALGIYATLALVSALILLTNQPPKTPLDATTAASGQGKLGLPVSIGLVAIILSFIGQGSIWAFLQILGITHGFSVTGVANAMSVWAITGIAGSLGAAALPSSISRYAAISVALVVLWLGLYALYSPASLTWYIAGCAVGGFYWNFFLSLLLGLLARIDHSGRGSVLGGTVSSAGAAVGPLFAGLLIVGTDYRPVGWMTAVLCTVALLCVWFIERPARDAALATG